MPEGIRTLVADRARSRLVVGFRSGAIASLSLPDLTPGPRLENAHHGNVDCLALSPDGRLLATGAADHRVVLRDAMSFETLLSFPLWTGTLRDLTFDSTGRRLAVVGTNCDVDLWDLAALSDGLTDLGLAWDRPAARRRLLIGPSPRGRASPARGSGHPPTRPHNHGGARAGSLKCLTPRLCTQRPVDFWRPERAAGAQPRVKPGVREHAPDLRRPEGPQEALRHPFRVLEAGRGARVPGFHPGLGSLGLSAAEHPRFVCATPL